MQSHNAVFCALAAVLNKSQCAAINLLFAYLAQSSFAYVKFSCEKTFRGQPSSGKVACNINREQKIELIVVPVTACAADLHVPEE
jgi:hypothetical protein